MSEENTEEVLETDEVEEESESKSTGSTIDNLEDALKALEKVRREAASRRLQSKDLQDKAAKWEAHVNSQKTELERLTEDKAAVDATNAELKLQLVRNRIAQETELDPDLLEFLTGSEEEMKAQAAKLVNKAATGSTGEKKDFYAGQRGKPLKPKEETVPDNLNDYFTYLWKQSDSNPTATEF